MDGPEYTVGRFTLRPHRQLLADGVPVGVGRKALHLLSVLAEAEGALVTKDELMARVWSRTVVEDNAIQVQVVALRKLLGGDGECLVTVRGLGYRLDAFAQKSCATADTSAGQAPPSPPAVKIDARQDGPGPIRRERSRGWLAAAATVTLGLAGLLLVRVPPVRSPPPVEGRVAVTRFAAPPADPAAHAFVDGLYDDVSSALADGQVVTVLEEPSSRQAGTAPRPAGPAADITLEGAVRSDGVTLDVRMRLEDTKEQATLWSDEIRGPVASSASLRTAAAARIADAATWARVGRSGLTRLNAAALASFIAGRESLTGVRHPDDMAALADYERVIAAAPDFSWGYSAAAATEGFQLLDAPEGPEADGKRAAARGEAQRALVLDPHNGEAYLALELLTPREAWRAREGLLLRGVAADPSFEPTSMMEGRLLWSMGRGREALDWLRSAHQLNPFFNGANFSLAVALADEGYPTESRTLLSQMELQWPDHAFTQDARFWVGMIAGRRAEVLKLLDEPERRPDWFDERTLAIWRAALKASGARPDAAVTRATDARIVAAANGGWFSHGRAVLLLTMLGDLDDAFAQARVYRPTGPDLPPYLFLPATAPLRADPRFMALAQRIGLVDYWRSTGRWPDFCSEPGLRYDCRAEAAKLHA